MNKKLILASSSEGRLEILKKMYIIPNEIIIPNIDEKPQKKEKSIFLVKRLAKEKAFKVLEIIKSELINKKRQTIENNLILAGDTIVICRGKLQEKTDNNDIIRQYLKDVSGRSVRVYSSICILDTNTEKCSIKTGETRIKIKILSKAEIDLYISLKEGINKAGGMGISGFAECFVEKIIGSYSNIIGLPSIHVYNLLNTYGYNVINNNYLLSNNN